MLSFFPSSFFAVAQTDVVHTINIQVADVKKSIETAQGLDVYPAAQQMLIHQGKVLKDTTTLEENKALKINKVSTSGTQLHSSAPSNPAQPATSTGQPTQTVTAPQATAASVAPAQSAPESTPLLLLHQLPSQGVHMISWTRKVLFGDAMSLVRSCLYYFLCQTVLWQMYMAAASNLVAGSTLEATVQQILDMGGGSWERDTVVRALRAAYNNPERAIEYSVLCGKSSSTGFIASSSSGGPNANPLIFPQGLPNVGSNVGAGNLDFLSNSPQPLFPQCFPSKPFEQWCKQTHRYCSLCFRSWVSKSQLMRLIQEHQADFLRLINEPVEGEGNVPGQPAGAIPQAVTVTPEEREAIERLEAMGFDRALVLQVFFACNKNEELAANYLLDHMHEFDE
ncbi:hypothetical protein HAX54_024491 [Datura stramonium]|uniref:Ubiquitin receptor RAD23 n=1 Tax=Datura stramonium TaxID=4076 RepID=A0ABS8UY34_DATST|nr:hypothetical protein [Datura stramonium]